jgi:hypothetical protein
MLCLPPPHGGGGGYSEIFAMVNFSNKGGQRLRSAIFRQKYILLGVICLHIKLVHCNIKSKVIVNFFLLHFSIVRLLSRKV